VSCEEYEKSGNDPCCETALAIEIIIMIKIVLAFDMTFQRRGITKIVEVVLLKR
jgi:hypothetical protein